MLHLHPAKQRKFIERLVRFKKKKETKNFPKKLQKHLPVRNKFSTCAPALRNTRNKKEIHVRRHIELTAALTEMLGQKNKE